MKISTLLDYIDNMATWHCLNFNEVMSGIETR